MVRWLSISLVAIAAGCAGAPGAAPSGAGVAMLGRDPAPLQVVLQEGEPTLLVFATVWCESCKREAPLVKAWLDAAPARRVVYVVSGSAPERVADFARAQGLERDRLAVIVDAVGAVAREYAVRATPTLFLIAKDGGRSPPVHAMEELPEPR